MKAKYPHILQTPSWGRAKSKAQPAWQWFFFAKLKGDDGWDELENVENWSEAQSSVLILERELGMGQKLHYIPRGPYVDWENNDEVEEVLDLVKNFAVEQGVLFTRFEPNVYEQDFAYELVKKVGFRRTEDFVQAKDTVKVAIDMPDEELMQSFHKKHRYNIRLAQKRGLTVRSSTDPEDVEIFYKLTEKTDVRSAGALSPHPASYYKAVVEELAKNGMARVYIVEKDERAASASVVFTFGDEAIYMFGASDYEYRRDMPNHLREWQSMQDAREEGRKYFDLWGVTMRDDPGGGIKRYKLGYRDHVEKMAGTFDWAANWWKYKIFNLLNSLRRKAT